MATITYTSASIKYYRINSNNTTIAQSPSGKGSPTEEITVPLASPGSYLSYNTGTKVVSGDTTNFNLFNIGQYLYYTNSSGDYVLMGQISAIGGATSLTLSSIVNTPPDSGVILSAAYALITNNESLYMRIQTNTSSAPNNQMYIPNFGLGYWRINANLTGFNNPDISTLERVSSVGNPLSSVDPADPVQYTLVTMNQFPVATTTGGVTTYFGTIGAFPSFIWIRITPSTSSVGTSLSSQTMYRLTTVETIPAIAIYVQTPAQKLIDAGYNNISGAASTSSIISGGN